MYMVVNVLNAILFANGTVLRAENESDLQKLVIVFDNVCKIFY